MEALPNAETVRESTSSSGLIPVAFPKVWSQSHKGVSVEYIHDESGAKKWFLFRASYGREDKAADILLSMNIYAYVPRRKEVVEVNGRPKKVLKNLIPNFVFAYLTDKEAAYYVRGPEPDDAEFGQKTAEERRDIFTLSGIITYYYDHFHTVGGKNPPLIIPAAQMNNLILATSTQNENLLVLEAAGQSVDFNFKSEEAVEVIAGEFKGVKGKVIRARRQQRILIELSGFALLATAYVPSAYLRKIV